MTDSAPSHLTICLGSEAPSDRLLPTPAVGPTAYAAPAQFLDLSHSEDLEMLSQIAAQLLGDPLAVQRLSEQVFELLQQDLMLQRERSYGYGRRW
jgi:hypothetical protein